MTELIRQPKRLDRDTLYELRSTLALHPYYQPARLLMLHNLYLLHDTVFDEEVRKAAIYITDRKVIFQMIEAAHYQLHANLKPQHTTPNPSNRTEALIDNFLDSIPVDEEEEKATKRKPTPADAAVDYVAYLIETTTGIGKDVDDTPQMKRQDLIDNFLERQQGRIQLKRDDDNLNPNENQNDNQNEKAAIKQEQNDASIDSAERKQAQPEANVEEEEYFTETLARIYIKQGRYQKALDIIGRLNQQFPHKNAYFADQMRFLEKLIINNNNNNKNKK